MPQKAVIENDAVERNALERIGDGSLEVVKDIQIPRTVAGKRVNVLERRCARVRQKSMKDKDDFHDLTPATGRVFAEP